MAFSDHPFPDHDIFERFKRGSVPVYVARLCGDQDATDSTAAAGIVVRAGGNKRRSLTAMYAVSTRCFSRTAPATIAPTAAELTPRKY